jgi:hypothetical protein
LYCSLLVVLGVLYERANCILACIS